jgi:GT2 family glycosyltransferase
VAGHAFRNFQRDDPGTPQFRPHLAQNLSAVTAACLAIRREVFFEAGSFDEQRFSPPFNEVDFCLKVQALGYRNLYTPFAELIHHEPAGLGPEDSPEKARLFREETAAIQERWGAQLSRDPAYNPNLSLDSEDFALAYPPRVPPLV